MKTVQESLKEFEAMLPNIENRADLIALRRKLIGEEYAETIEALDFLAAELTKENPDSKKAEELLKDLTKELADLTYVVYGTAVCFGVDLDKGFESVHRSNMSKLEAKAGHRDDGKLLKGENYVAPDMAEAIENNTLLD